MLYTAYIPRALTSDFPAVRLGRALLLAYAVLFISASPAYSESPSQVINRYGLIIEAQIPRILELMRPNMTEREREIADETRFRVTRSDVNNAAAYVDDAGRRIIEIHVGVVRSAEAIAIARGYALVTGRQDLNGEWLEYVANEIERRRSDPVNARDFGVIQNFPAYIGMTETAFAEFLSDPKVDEYIELEMNSSMMWLIGHELGHHFHNHRPTPDRSLSRTQEAEADAVAHRLMRNTGYNPAFGLAILIGFALWDPEAHYYEFGSTHPSPVRRIEKNVLSGVDQLMQDPDFMQYLKDTGRMDEFKDTIEEDLNALRGLTFPNW